MARIGILFLGGVFGWGGLFHRLGPFGSAFCGAAILLVYWSFITKNKQVYYLGKYHRICNLKISISFMSTVGLANSVLMNP